MLPVQPRHRDLEWRHLQPGDARLLYRLHLACGRADGSTHRYSRDHFMHLLMDRDLETDTKCATNEYGEIVVAGDVRFELELAHERRALLSGLVHPDYRGRGLGHFILNWMMVRAHQKLGYDDDPRPAVMRIEYYSMGQGAQELYEQNGFSFAFAEDHMQRNLSEPLPEYPVPEDFTVEAWNEDNQGDFFHVYNEAFKERDDFPGWSQKAWIRNMTRDDTFQPEYSVLVRGEEDKPAAFALSSLEKSDEGMLVGWVLQFGVHPDFRRRGLGAAVLTDVLANLKEAGAGVALIEMLVGDMGAKHFLEGLGFEFVRQRVTYQKAL